MAVKCGKCGHHNEELKGPRLCPKCGGVMVPVVVKRDGKKIKEVVLERLED